MQAHQKLAITNNIAGGLGFAVFFAAYLKQSWRFALENPALLQSLRLFLFPFIMLTEVVKTGLSWRLAKRENYKTAPLIRAIHDTVSTAVGITAVALGFTIGAVYGTLAPLMFTVLLGFNSLVHLASSIYYAVKGNKPARNDHLAASLVLGLFSASIGALTFVGNSILSIIGLAGAALGVGYAVYKGYKEYQAQKAQKLEQVPQTQGDNAKEALKSNKSARPNKKRHLTVLQGSALTAYQGSLINNLSAKAPVNDNQFKEQPALAPKFKAEF